MADQPPKDWLPPWVYVPFSELPLDADPVGRGKKYTFGSDVFGGSDDWIIVENNTNPTKIYKIPEPVTKILRYMFDARYEAGVSDAKKRIRSALGLD